jgi:hypothetical protein
MKPHILLTALSVLIGCTFSLFPDRNVLAAEPSPVKDSIIEDVSSKIPTALKLGIGSGIIEYINNARQIKVLLEWEPLAITDSLIQQSTYQDFTITKLKIRNKDLENNDWTRSINSNDLPEVLKAFNVDNLDRLKQLTPKVDPALALLELKTLKSSEYLQMQQERNVLKALLASKGVKYSFGLKPTENAILSPEFIDGNITWYVDIYSFKKKDANIYYRFTAKAVVDPLEIRVTDNIINTTQKKIFYSVRFKLKDGSVITNQIVTNEGAVDAPIKKDRVATNSKEAITAALTPLNGFLSIIGGSENLAAAAQGLLGGTENTSIVGGGLVGFKNTRVSPFIGVNQEIGKVGNSITGGLLFGIGTGDRTSLFVGPSLQASIFTLSAGATVGSEANSEINFAGMIAIDLSRLTNSRKDSTFTQVAIANQLNTLSNIRDEIINKYTLINYKSKDTILLTRICDQNNSNIPENNKSARNIISLKSPQFKMTAIPRGVYEYTNKSGGKMYISLVEDQLEVFDVDSAFNTSEKPVCN